MQNNKNNKKMISKTNQSIEISVLNFKEKKSWSKKNIERKKKKKKERKDEQVWF